jgi:hypothetical protein
MVTQYVSMARYHVDNQAYVCFDRLIAASFLRISQALLVIPIATIAAV